MIEREGEKPKLVRLSKSEYKATLQFQKERYAEKFMNGTLTNEENLKKLFLDMEDILCKESENESLVVRYFMDCNTGKLTHKVYPKGKMGLI